jgi:hypothetical protein
MPQAMRAGEVVFMPDKIARNSHRCNGRQTFKFGAHINQVLISPGVLQLN